MKSTASGDASRLSLIVKCLNIANIGQALIISRYGTARVNFASLVSKHFTVSTLNFLSLSRHNHLKFQTVIGVSDPTFLNNNV